MRILKLFSQFIYTFREPSMNNSKWISGRHSKIPIPSGRETGACQKDGSNKTKLWIWMTHPRDRDAEGLCDSLIEFRDVSKTRDTNLIAAMCKFAGEREGLNSSLLINTYTFTFHSHFIVICRARHHGWIVLIQGPWGRALLRVHLNAEGFQVRTSSSSLLCVIRGWMLTAVVI